MPWPGEDEAWEVLSGLNPDEVTENTLSSFDPNTHCYNIRCFDQEISISITTKVIEGYSPLACLILERFGELSRLSILRYLIHGQRRCATGQLVRPASLAGGKIFQQGTHVLPLDKLAERFGERRDGFLKKGTELGGVRLEYGDCSLEIPAFPHFPVTIIIWSGDKEFPAKASLLLDSGCVSTLPMDVVWAVSTLAMELMLLGE